LFRDYDLLQVVYKHKWRGDQQYGE
jgi:hypothetical protein